TFLRSINCALGPLITGLRTARLRCMTIEQATKLIKSCAERMNTRYQRVVFDEWAIVCFVGKRGYLLAYTGPRREGFQRDFLNDVRCLQESLLGKKHDAGDFDFAHDGVGTGFES